MKFQKIRRNSKFEISRTFTPKETWNEDRIEKEVQKFAARFYGHTMKEYSKILRQDGIRLDNKPGGLSNGTITKDKSVISTMSPTLFSKECLVLILLYTLGSAEAVRKPPKNIRLTILPMNRQNGFYGH
ncbi:hypothetical protein [Lacrimispora sphenoides]|uniref:Uncharacterized protein n=1 Tax=Lacrimispora sphenoides JCM 1415 TaxID=1297793 RepID=A0ABY1C5T5_9FIRM|nr:hypothetical protein [Lacrimispora sphenoides]SET71300.1 hypothetical protein SAMN02745906_1322 [[Clostridium] sphenoides JCM 1415]SUY50688.1 Uncharacterised protein [Lacrimispora sphenoides]